MQKKENDGSLDESKVEERAWSKGDEDMMEESEEGREQFEDIVKNLQQP